MSVQIVTTYPIAVAPGSARDAQTKFAVEFGIVFDTCTVLDTRELSEIASSSDGSFPVVRTLSRKTPTLFTEFEEMRAVANKKVLSMDDRGSYMAALDAIYQSMHPAITHIAAQPNTLVICPEREGRILGQRYGHFDPRRHSIVHAKRSVLDGIMVVGLSRVKSRTRGVRALIIDGAIASGGTVVALLDCLRHEITEFHIFAAHSAPEGIRAIKGFSALARIAVEITVGHVSGTLNGKRYAVDPIDPDSVIVGDLGDILSPLGDQACAGVQT